MECDNCVNKSAKSNVYNKSVASLPSGVLKYFSTLPKKAFEKMLLVNETKSEYKRPSFFLRRGPQMKSQGQDSQSGQGQEENSVFILSSVSSQEKVQLSPKELELMQNLFDWRDRSKKTQWILGKPLNY
jgi:hypothetical protein